VWRASLRICALVSTIVAAAPRLAGAAAAPADPDGCQATPDRPVAVCFEPQPLTVDHCSRTIVPHFDIDVWTPPDRKPARYRYSYQLLVNGANSSKLVVVGDADNPDAYPFTALTKADVPVPTTLEFAGAASYALRVAVAVDGKPPVGAVSAAVRLDDRPRVRGLAIGISNYTLHPSLKLNYADADAASFRNALTSLLSAGADVQIEQRTSDMDGSDHSLTKDAILHSLDDVVSGVQLCGDDDWFVFFFSGHGIVGVNRQEKVGRYLSTKAFDPAELTRTSIRMTDLAAKLSGTGARNLLVVLDSCFSGFHIKADAASARGRGVRVAAPSSGKVQYVSDGAVHTAQIQSDADSNVLRNSTLAMEQDSTRAWILTAASSDTEAEEGPASYVTTDGKNRIVLQFERASVAENTGKPGHGLYTFALLSNLLAQLPAGTDVSTLLPGSKPPSAETADCTLDVQSAASGAREDIQALGRQKSWQLQDPEATATKTTPPKLTCQVTRPEAP
jgi:caspase domain-containing protein